MFVVIVLYCIQFCFKVKKIFKHFPQQTHSLKIVFNSKNMEASFFVTRQGFAQYKAQSTQFGSALGEVGEVQAGTAELDKIPNAAEHSNLVRELRKSNFLALAASECKWYSVWTHHNPGSLTATFM